MFGVLIAGLGSLASVAISPWLPEFSWWKVFRRCVSVAAALSLLWMVWKVEGRSLRSYGLARERAGKRQLAVGLSMAAGGLALLFSIGLLTGACRVDLTPDRAKLWTTLLGFIPAAGLVALLEELVFRGFILQQLLPCSKIVAVTVSSALYSVVHLKSATFTLGTALELGGLWILGAVLAVSYLRTGQLYTAIGLHAMLAYAARVNKLVIDFPHHSLNWLTGTSRLVNGLAGWVALLLMAACVVWWTSTQHRRWV